MRKVQSFLLSGFFFAAIINCISCKGDIVEPVSSDELYELAYNGSKFPEGFYKEAPLQGSYYYENTISIKPLDSREHKSIQLSTGSRTTAREWSELSSKYSSEPREITSEEETEKYFEFVKISKAYPNHKVLSRVHKSSYLDRTMYDFFNPGKVIGIFKKSSFNITDIKELIEYLWYVGHYDSGGIKVHRYELGGSATEFTYTMYEILVSFGDFGMHDNINYYKSVYTINKITGEIFLDKELVKNISGKLR